MSVMAKDVTKEVDGEAKNTTKGANGEPKNKKVTKTAGEEEAVGMYNRKPPKKHWSKHILDTEEKTFINRTGSSWGLIILFYICFYCCLAAFWAICWAVFAGILPELSEGPQHTNLIGKHPGVWFRPLPPDDDLKRKPTSKPFIHYNKDDKDHAENRNWVERITKFLQKATTEGDVNVADLGPCGTEPYGYRDEDEVKICVYLRLNRLWDWTPNAITEAKDNWPQDFQIGSDSVFFSCAVTSDKGNANYFKEVNYFPNHRSIPIAGNFPFKGASRHPSTLVAVQFIPQDDFKSATVECKAFYDGKMLLHCLKMSRGLYFIISRFSRC